MIPATHTHTSLCCSSKFSRIFMALCCESLMAWVWPLKKASTSACLWLCSAIPISNTWMHCVVTSFSNVSLRLRKRKWQYSQIVIQNETSGSWRRICLEKRGHSGHTRYQLGLWIIFQHALHQTRPVQVLHKCILSKNHLEIWHFIACTLPIKSYLTSR